MNPLIEHAGQPKCPNAAQVRMMVAKRTSELHVDEGCSLREARVLAKAELEVPA